MAPPLGRQARPVALRQAGPKSQPQPPAGPNTLWHQDQELPATTHGLAFAEAVAEVPVLQTEEAGVVHAGRSKRDKTGVSVVEGLTKAGQWRGAGRQDRFPFLSRSGLLTSGWRQSGPERKNKNLYENRIRGKNRIGVAQTTAPPAYISDRMGR